jgi:hypothetical protein
MRLAAQNMPVAVAVVVFPPCSEMAKDLRLVPFYHEWIRFRTGEGILGDVADFFEQVGRKRRREHESGIARYNGEVWADVCPWPWWRPQCRRLLLMTLLRCCCWWVFYAAVKWILERVWETTEAHPLMFLFVVCAMGVMNMVRWRVAAFKLKPKAKEGSESGEKDRIYN